MGRIRRKSVRWNGLQIHVKDRVVLKPVQQKNPRKSKNLTRQKRQHVLKRRKKFRRKNVKRAGSKMLVLFLAVKLTLMILKRKKTNPNAKCKKSWFKDACVVSCCKANSDD